MKRTVCIVLLIALMLPTMACYRLTHEVGTGASGTDVVSEERQWYAVFGLVDMNDVSSKAMSRNAENYTIVTEMETMDFIISLFTGIATIQCWTVKVIE